MRGAAALSAFALCSFLQLALAHAQDEVAVEAEAPMQASSHPLSVRFEPGLAMAVTAPQSDRTDMGFGQTIKLSVGLLPFLEVGPSATFTTLPADDEMADAGTSWSVGGGVRLLRPHTAAAGKRGFQAASPWVDADLLYVRTGSLDRPGFAAAAGFGVPLDDRRQLWLGPYVRYFQIVQGEREGYDSSDAKLLTFGLSLEVGSGLQRRQPVAVAAVAAAPPSPPPASDRDGDGVADSDDRCPDVAGPAESSGCPPQVVITPDKIEVKQKIAFEWSSSQLTPESHAALDEVVLALRDNPAIRVEVEGHASSEGDDALNQPLSEQRATAVLDYLIAHGVARDRLASRGFSSSVPLQSNATPAGRESNRRVEFVVHFIIVKPAPAQETTP